MSELHVWMNGQPVAVWSQGRTGASRLSYLREWAESPQSRSLSLSLQIPPGLTLTGPVVDHYFDNLLPDNDGIRERLKRRFGAGSLRPFDLLTAIGRDCVGAVQLLPPGHEPVGFDQLDYRRLKEDDIARLLRGVASDRGLGAQAADDDEFRISIAGAQEKTALLRVGKTWCAPHGATPTTHILKLPLGIIGGGLDMTHSVENAEAVPRAIAEVEAELPTDFPPRVFEAITQGLARQAKAFLKPAGAAPPTS